MTKKEWLSNIMWIIGVIVVTLLIKKFVFTPVIVSGDSMAPNLQHHEMVFATRRSKIERFEIVTFPSPYKPKETYVKRIIGLAGETVAYRADQLYIDGKEVAEPFLEDFKAKLPVGEYLTHAQSGPGFTSDDFSLQTLFGIEKVPAGSVFVLGDNRQDSTDGRVIGFVAEDAITGYLKFAYWPPSRFGKVQ